jgi:glycosyltransferase involved in cell wall biosynthesis
MLSVICTFVNEYPQIAFTLQALALEFQGREDVEVICVNNYCKEVADQGFPEDRGAAYLRDRVGGPVWGDRIKVISYDKKLSHWNAKNFGVQHSSGDLLLFLDAHVVPSPNLFQDMEEAIRPRGNSVVHRRFVVHAPLAYLNDSPENSLIYKAVCSKQLGMAHYRFMRFTDDLSRRPELAFPSLFPVPVMSTCGMMMWRGTYDFVGGWPEALGIYGGGENFINYALGTMGVERFVLNSLPLYHYAEKRGYRWNGRDWLRNRMIAAYLVGGEEWLTRCSLGMLGADKLDARGIRILQEQVLLDRGIQERRSALRQKQLKTLDDFLADWADSPLYQEAEVWT